MDKECLYPEIFELVCQLAAVRAQGKVQLIPDFENVYREALEETLNSRRAEVSAKAAEAWINIRNSRRGLTNYNTNKMAAV